MTADECLRYLTTHLALEERERRERGRMMFCIQGNPSGKAMMLGFLPKFSNVIFTM
jgi:hypothetical protein